MIHGNMVGAYSSLGKTFVFTSDDGKEFAGVVVEKEEVFDATANDIREGKLAATSEGVTEGTKVIPSYHTSEGIQVITAGSEFKISFVNFPELSLYDYTKLQAIICLKGTTLASSVAAEQVSINDNVYAVGSVDSIASVSKDNINGEVNLGVVNNTENPMILRYFTYKEIE